MKIRVYKGTILAASFDAGQPLAFHGQPGQQVKSLIQAETQDSPGRAPDRLLHADLPNHGFQIVNAQGPGAVHNVPARDGDRPDV